MSIKPLIYRSTDAGAPQLTGQAGSLVAVLDAVLVDGYGGGVDVKAPAGWTREFMASNKRVYRNSIAHGTGTYLRVDDTGSEQLAEPRIAWMRAYEVMSDVDTGINPCPMPSQLARGSSVFKSTVASSLSRAWTIIACNTYAYIFIDVAGETDDKWKGGGLAATFIGDYISLKTGDVFCFIVAADIKQSYSNSAFSGIFYGGYEGVVGIDRTTFVLRGHSGIPGAVRAGSIVSRFLPTSGNWGGRGFPYPLESTGGAAFDEGFITLADYVPAGKLPGLLVPMHPYPFPEMVSMDIEGGRYVAKRYYMAYFNLSGNPSRGQVMIEAHEHG